jgi:hypothetical protein
MAMDLMTLHPFATGCAMGREDAHVDRRVAEEWDGQSLEERSGMEDEERSWRKTRNVLEDPAKAEVIHRGLS